MRREDMVLGAFILVPILCLIIPVPLFLLDLLFALNIALSMIILFNALFSKEPLDMSAFPTLLLLTTLFRLSLNVSSTRNILLKADAGNVVDTFGNFVRESTDFDSWEQMLHKGVEELHYIQESSI